jgi:UDP:flavonoid glycosyltransferase YjiC (YdhE family)
LARALLALEFGGDLGHARRAVAIARQLRELGHEAAFALPDLAAVSAEDVANVRCVPTPLLRMPDTLDPSPLNASDVLLNLGYGDADALAGALSAWASLFRLLRPAAVVCDYAPTALLAARAAGLQALALGSGFSMPPRGEPMPSLRPWAGAQARALEERDARLLASVREAWRASGAAGAAPARAGDVFAANAQLVCAWPELDHYGTRADVEYLGPQQDIAAAKEVSWATESRPRIFAYLKPRDPRFDGIVAGIAAQGGEAVVAAPGLPEARAQELSRAGPRVIAEPVAVDAMAQADLWVSHGSAGIVAAGMRLGVPQALLPLQLEQYLVALRAEQAGIACLFDPAKPHPDLSEWLAAARTSVALKHAAAAARKLLAGRTPVNAGERIAQALRR